MKTRFGWMPRARFADEPSGEGLQDDGADPTGPTTSGGEGDRQDDPGNPGGQPSNSQTFTQVDVNRIIESRLGRERQQFEQVLSKLGIEGGIQGVDEHLQKQKQQTTQQLADQKRYKELWEQEKSDKERLLAEKESKLQELAKAREADYIERELLKAASKSVAPPQVAALCREKMRFDPETRSVYVVDDLGNRMTDGQGGYLSVDGYVDRFLQQNPHFARAAGGQGAGSGAPSRPPSTNTHPGGALGFDLNRVAEGDIDYILENEDKIQRAIQDGALSQ